MNLLEAFNFVLRSALGFLFATAGFLAVIALENHGIEIPLDTDPLFSLLVGFAIGGFLIGGKLLTAQSRNHYILYGGNILADDDSVLSASEAQKSHQLTQEKGHFLFVSRANDEYRTFEKIGEEVRRIKSIYKCWDPVHLFPGPHNYVPVRVFLDPKERIAWTKFMGQARALVTQTSFYESSDPDELFTASVDSSYLQLQAFVSKWSGRCLSEI
jgi:hypothetical protein